MRGAIKSAWVVEHQEVRSKDYRQQRMQCRSHKCLSRYARATVREAQYGFIVEEEAVRE